MFLPGSKDLTKASMTLTKMGSEARRTFVCLQLEAKTSQADKDTVEKAKPAAFGVDVKVVFATNIAEASVTIDGLVYVVDSGLEKFQWFDPAMNCSTLDTNFISQAQIRQRWGRVGRTQSGYAYCLHTEEQFQGLQEFPTPAMLSTDLTGVALSLMKNPRFYCVAGVVHAFKNMHDAPSSPRDTARHRESGISRCFAEVSRSGPCDSPTWDWPWQTCLSPRKWPVAHILSCLRMSPRGAENGCHNGRGTVH